MKQKIIIYQFLSIKKISIVSYLSQLKRKIEIQDNRKYQNFQHCIKKTWLDIKQVRSLL